MILAAKTIQAINDRLELDGGAGYRGHLREAINACSDAFSTEEQGFRTHLGCSLLGKKCARELWLSFRWAKKKVIPAKLQRLFNRGHMEEGRSVALLRSIGCQVVPNDPITGKQFRVAGYLGHVGGSLDGVVRGLPDLSPDTWALQEFKTSGDKPFQKLKAFGCKEEKFEHYVQQQLYMNYYNLSWSLYLVTNKNDDDLHGELIQFDGITGPQYMDRGAQVVAADTPPAKINESPGWFGCRFCDMHTICHSGEPPLRTCRSCRAAKPSADGEWVCLIKGINLTKEAQLAACSTYDQIRM